MTEVAHLYGGPADGQVLAIRQATPTVRMAVAEPLQFTWDEPVDPTRPVTFWTAVYQRAHTYAITADATHWVYEYQGQDR
jgi:hypothetical protein